MKLPLALVLLVFTAPTLGQQGVIYGVAIGQDDQPAKGVGVTLHRDVPGLQALPSWSRQVKTTPAGEYRFEHLEVGRYIVFVYDEDAGYIDFQTSGASRAVKVDLTDGQPEARVRVYLPPRAGFLDIDLTNQQSGAPVSGIQLDLTWAGSLEKIRSAKNPHLFLVPPDTDVLLHVSSPGFREWQESVGTGKSVCLPSGTRLKLDVRLEPLDY
jgi:hypothetical protein